jgi:hypothetical protein
MAIGGASSIKFGITDTGTYGGQTLRIDPSQDLTHSISWADGNGAGEAEDTLLQTLTLTGTDSVDLARVDGTTITATHVKALYLEAPAANSADVTVSFNDTNGWSGFCSDNLVLKPGTALLMQTRHATGYALTAGTGDLMTVTGTAGNTLKIAAAVNV